MTTNWPALPALSTKELTSSSVSGLCNSPPRRPWTALAAFDFLVSFASGIPNIVLLHALAPDGQTAGFVGDGDMQPPTPRVVIAKAAIQNTTVNNPRVCDGGREGKSDIFMSCTFLNKLIYRKQECVVKERVCVIERSSYVSICLIECNRMKRPIIYDDVTIF